MPNEQHLERFSWFPFPFLYISARYLFVIACLFVACSEQNNRSFQDMIVLLKWCSFEIDMFEKDYNRLSRHTSNSIHTLLSRWMCERTAWYWYDAWIFAPVSVSITVLLWLKTVCGLSNTRNHLKFFLWSFTFGEVYVIMTVYVRHIYRTPCWRVSEWATGCITVVHMAVLLTSMDEQEKEITSSYTKTHSWDCVWCIRVSSCADAWIVRH